MVFSSRRHLMVAGGCIIVMEIVYKMDFSLPGFLICSVILGFGMPYKTSCSLCNAFVFAFFIISLISSFCFLYSFLLFLKLEILATSQRN